MPSPLCRGKSPTTVTCHFLSASLAATAWLDASPNRTHSLSCCQGSTVVSVSICSQRKSFLVFSSTGIPALPWLNIASGLLLPRNGGLGFLLLQWPQSTFALLLAFLMPSSLLHLAAQCPDQSTAPADEAAVTPNLPEAPGTPCSLHLESHIPPGVVISSMAQ